MNDQQLYNLYLSHPLPDIVNRKSKIYPKYVVITGRAFAGPHPCRHFSFLEFLDAIEKDDNLRNILLK